MSIRQKLRQRFEDFRPEIEDLVTQVEGLDATYSDELGAIEGYIGSGPSAHVFRLQSDPSFVVKLPYESADRGTSLRQVVRGCVRARIPGMTLPGLDQIVGYNDDRHRKPYGLLFNFVDGSSFSSLGREDIQRVPREHYLGLMATFQAMQQNGLGFYEDANGLRHNANGFTFTRYALDARQPLEQKVRMFVSDGMMLYGVPIGSEVPEHGLMYREACEEVLGGNMAAAINDEWRRMRLVVPA